MLTADGCLSVKASSEVATAGYAYDPRDPVPTCGATLVGGFPAGVFDQTRVESRDDVLVFTSEVLAGDVEVTGKV